MACRSSAGSSNLPRPYFISATRWVPSSCIIFNKFNPPVISRNRRSPAMCCSGSAEPYFCQKLRSLTVSSALNASSQECRTTAAGVVSDHPKTYFFERPTDRATSSAPQAQSSVPLSVSEATAHNLSSAHGRAGLNLPPAPDVAQLPDCRPLGRNRRAHFNE